MFMEEFQSNLREKALRELWHSGWSSHLRCHDDDDDDPG